MAIERRVVGESSSDGEMHRRRRAVVALLAWLLPSHCSFVPVLQRESLQGLTIVSRGPSSLLLLNKVTNVIKDMSNGFQIFSGSAL